MFTFIHFCIKTSFSPLGPGPFCPSLRHPGGHHRQPWCAHLFIHKLCKTLLNVCVCFLTELQCYVSFCDFIFHSTLYILKEIQICTCKYPFITQFLFLNVYNPLPANEYHILVFIFIYIWFS